MFTPTIVWALLGLGLVIMEMMTGTFILLFFGFASLLVALTKKLTGFEDVSLEIVAFALVGLAGFFLLRKKMSLGFQTGTVFSTPADKSLTLNVTIAPHHTTTVSRHGTSWMAINDTDVEMKAGETVIIDRMEGVKLILKQSS